MHCWLFLLLAASFRAVWACKPGISYEKCKQVLDIAGALGKTKCASGRDFYDCLRVEGCYTLPAACKKADGSAVSCTVACENEPFFATCRDNTVRTKPGEDFNLCPHITKAMQSTPAPTVDDFIGAPAIPFTLQALSKFDRQSGSAEVSNVLPTLWPAGLRKVLSSIFGLNPFAVRVETPILHRRYISRFERSPDPFDGAEETTFMVFYIHVLDETQVSATRSMFDTALVGEIGVPPLNISAVEKALRQTLNATLPNGAGLTLQQLQLYFISGRVDRFPETTTTTILTTTSSINPFLVLQQWKAWRIRCSVGIVFRWEIEELEFWSNGCPPPQGKGTIKLLPTDATSNSTIPTRLNLSILSSGDLDNSCCRGPKAFDGLARTDFIEGTAWVSGCRSCNLGEAYLGLDGGADGRFSVACVVYQQGHDATNQCEKTVIEASNDPDLLVWQRRAEVLGFGAKKFKCIARTRDDYPNIECGSLDDGCRGSIDFGTCPGFRQACEDGRCRCTTPTTGFDPRFDGWECGVGSDGCNGTIGFGTCTDYNSTCVNHRCKDDSFKASMWRLVCESGTVGRWWIKEVEFHQEGLCLNRLTDFKKTISSGSLSAGNPESSAFDGKDDSFWVSDCMGCPKNRAWIGLDFGAQIRVSCVRLVQHELTIQQCQRIVLQYSDEGLEWSERYRYGFGDYTLSPDEKLVPGLDVEKSDKDKRPTQRMARYWRLSCDKELRHQWGIFELDMYDDAGCKSSLRRGLKSILHSRGSSWAPENAFDWRANTLWKTGCGRCTGGVECRPCRRGKAYLGIEFKKLVIVKCVKIQQLETGLGDCPSLNLQFSNTGLGNDWSVRDTFEDVGNFAYLVPYLTATDLDSSHRQHSVGVCSSVIAVLALGFGASRT